MKVLTVLLLVLALGRELAASEPVAVFDLAPILQSDFHDEQQRRRYWDEVHLVTALEGLVNRDQPRLFVRFLKNTDDFWWGEMRKPGAWLASCEIIHVHSLDDLLAHFRQYYHGAVVWDERVPSGSDLASTIAGCDDLLPLRYDAKPDSLYRRLTGGANPMPVRARLPLFTGKGTIPETGLASTGSAKCDAYLWLVEKYLKSGKANPLCMGYYMDAFWLKCWKAEAPQNNALCNHDYIIAHRGLLFDLGVWDDESPVDDPGQRPGTDAATLMAILKAANVRTGGNNIIDVAGFVPWAYKYTDHHSREWFAGGHHGGVATEWRYAEILSCFNACMDADALSLNALPNASFYQHFPLAAHYRQNPKPGAQVLTERGLVNGNGRVAPRTYVAFYVGDYDSAAWLYQELPKMWRDPARGKTPLSWAFDPNLCQRFPPGLAWAYASRTTNDWFVAGDSGAGYLNPGYLTPPRPWSDLPSGLPAWEQRCRRYYQQWDISLTGFVINGNAQPLSPEGLDAYARFSPGGIVEAGAAHTVHNGMPALPMASDITESDPAEAAQHILNMARGPGLHLLACRSILKTPTWHARVEEELKSRGADKIKIVDLYTLLQLARMSAKH